MTSTITSFNVDAASTQHSEEPAPQQHASTALTSAYTGPSRPATQLDTNSAVSRMLRERVMPKTAINIANRDDANGGGRDWDHKTIQNLSGRQTVAVASEEQRGLETEMARRHFESKGLPVKPFQWFNERKLPFPVGVPNVREDGKSGEGLLVVPGGPTSLDSEVLGRPGVPGADHGEEGVQLRYPPKEGREASARERARHQANLLRDARNNGQPVLAICGGSWHLAKAFGGNTVTSPEFEARHTADMPALVPIPREDGGPADMGVEHATIMQHPVHVDGDSLLANALEPKAEGCLDVNTNSVHWAEVLSKPSQKGEIVGIAGTDPMTERNTGGLPVTPPNTDDLLKVTARVTSDTEGHATIEGFEARHGAPIIGVQHHPEALAGRPTLSPEKVATSTFVEANYDPERKQAEALFDYMAKAGDAYAARRTMTRDFKQKMTEGDRGEFPLPSSFRPDQT